MNKPSFLSEAVLYHDYRGRDFKDLSGNNNDGVPTDVYFTGDGLKTNATDGNVLVSDADSLDIDEVSIVAFGDFNNKVLEYYLEKDDALLFYYSGTSLVMGSATNTSRVYDITGAKYLAVNMCDDECPEIFRDGIRVETADAAVSIGTNANDLHLLNNKNNAFNSKNGLKSILIFPRKLTASEHSALYGYLDSLYFDTKVKSICNADLKVQPEPLIKANGVEEVTDGDMEAIGVGDWLANDSTLTKQTGTRTGGTGVQVLRVARDASTYWATQILMTVGKTYRLRGWARSDGNDAPYVFIHSSTSHWTGTNSTDWQYFDITGVAEFVELVIGSLGNTVGAYVEFDDVSVQEMTGLIAGYNMKPEGGVLVDQSENNNDGIITGALYKKTLLGDTMVFDESSIEIADVDSPVATISQWVKVIDNPTNAWSFNKWSSSNDAWGIYWRIDNNIMIFDDIDNANMVRYHTPYSNNVWNHVVVVMTGSYENKLYFNGELVGSGAFSSAGLDSFVGTGFIGSRNNISNGINAEITTTKIYNEEKDLDWVIAEYNLGKNALFKTEAGAFESVANQTEQIENTPFKVDSGAFKITRDTIDSSDVKVIEGVSSGEINISTSEFQQTPIEGAYGEWNFEFYKKDSSILDINFIANIIGSEGDTGLDGYNIRLNSSDNLVLKRINGASVSNLIVATNGDVPVETWTKLKITRSVSGEFSIYLNDVLVTATVGTNPITDNIYTESNYINIHLNTGDKIAYSSKGGHSINKYITT